MPVSVLIKLDSVPSKENKRVMRDLQAELENNRGVFSMRIDFITRTKKDKPEAYIQVGTRAEVSGYNSIIPELRKARALLSSVSSEDTLGQFFRSEMNRKNTENAHEASGGEDKSLTSAFTRATAEREKRRPQKGVKNRPVKENDDDLSPAPAKPPKLKKDMPAIGDDEHDRQNSRRILAGSADEAPDNSNCAGLGDMDEATAKYWKNQFVTSGI